MSIITSKLTSQGQVSVPAKIRRKLGLRPGSTIEWDAAGDHVIVRRAGRCTSEEIHRAIFETPPEGRSLEQLKAGLRRNVAARHARD